ncbi:putative ubiquitin-conjugating enzyme E2 Z [Apostichopus japonicus]|uniref:Ubiquitin-conjugating enzyme E2 Z n=1 Tax=Stichopus japonicus TaxID=307972 RepID=A0A2G8KWS6_STIJA|nr:putative ubiquitin-conjugating enzyme E2 Z [Apostichopus japonicus]
MAHASTSKSVGGTSQSFTTGNASSQLFATALSDLQTLAPWDPQKSEDWNQQTVERASLLRIKRDIMNIYSDPPPGMCVFPEDDITKVHALVTGPFDTPYEGGFFHFMIRFPPDYPNKPPRVKLLTTGNNSVRFNPNLYHSGKVCLSILGTWQGPAWKPAQCLASLLISIQSLMNDKPYHNEPGFETEKHAGDCERYNECIRHETLRVAVCQMMNDPNSAMPAPLISAMENLFPDYFESYMSTIKEKMHLDGQVITDPFGARRGHFNYKAIKQKLVAIQARLAEKGTKESDNSSSLSDMETD